MPKASLIQYAFNGGQLGPRMQGRPDLTKYATGCSTLENFIPTVQGPALKRSGTRFILETKDSADLSRLIPFEFSREQAYVLEFGDQYMRPYRNGGVVLETPKNIITAPTAANPVLMTIAVHGFSNGDKVLIQDSAMVELNGRVFEVANALAGSFELLGEDGTGRSTGTGGTCARIYEIATPYTSAQLAQLQYVQSADVLYLAHPDVAPYKIERTSDTAWTSTEIDFDAPPFRVENSSATTIYASAGTGAAVTLTASASVFTNDMIGSFVKLSEIPAVEYPKWRSNTTLLNKAGTAFVLGDRLYHESNVYESDVGPSGSTGFDPPVHEEGSQTDRTYSWLFINKGAGWGKITGVTSGTVCTVDVDTDGVEYPESVVGVSNATKKWSLGAWSDEHGYPRAVTFYEDRLWWGGTDKDPQTFWGSRTGDYENHETIPDLDDSAVLFTLAKTKINAIEWMIGEDVLILGTRGGEFAADSGSADEAITPSNIRVRNRSSYGSAENVPPIAIDSALLFLHRSKRRLHDLIFDFDTDRYNAPDLTEFSEDILGTGAVELAYQASPFRMLWVVLEDGTLASLVYVREQDVVGWSKHVIGGTAAKVESIAVIPHPDGDEDQVWMIVSRTINGGTKRYIETLEKPFMASDVLADAFFVDSGLTYDGASTSTITELGHLEGETVTVLGDGANLGTFTVSNFAITLGLSVVKAQVGIAIPAAKLQTMRLEGGNPQGTSQGKRGRVYQIVVRVDNSIGTISYGPDFTNQDDYTIATNLLTGDLPALESPGGWEREKRVALQHALPLPCTIVSLMAQMDVENR